MQRPKVLALAPYCDGSDVGEAWCAFTWVRELSKQADVTLIALERPGRLSLEKQLPEVKIISRPEPSWARKFERLNAMAKLSYAGYFSWAKKTIKSLIASGEQFDVAHQFSPIALRFPSPLKHFDIPYVLGPLGGSLKTPAEFKDECGNAAWYTRFRNLDNWRLSLDPFLKSSYRKADVILGVAPYVKDLLADNCTGRFETMSELGIDQLKMLDAPNYQTGRLRMLHVGRGVRTKGLRDCIRALDMLRDVPGVHLDVAGKGEEIEFCQNLAKQLKVSHLVTFHGQISRDQVDQLYAKSDVFCFPSFREPSGSVVFEALSFGLPAIVADRGGPANVVDDTCGFKIAVTEPEHFAEQIAAAARTLASMPSLRRELSKGAHEKMKKIGLWPAKIARLLAIYEDIIPNQGALGKVNTSCPKTTGNPNFSLSPQVEVTGYNS